MVAGAAIAFLPLPSRTLVLVLAVGLLGIRLVRKDAIGIPAFGNSAIVRQ
jgi:hypothetical protein